MRSSRPRTVLAATAVAAAVLVSLVFDAAPAGAGVLKLKAGDTVLVKMRGNGHGHGMSQYGARGAAIAGKSYKQILAFYYPHTKLHRLDNSAIRVRLSGFGKTTTVAASTHLSVSGVSGKLATSGIRRYRLVANSGTGLNLQRLKSATGSKWTTIKTGLPNQAKFDRTGNASIRVYKSDGSSISYGGYLRAIRADASGSSGGVYTVNTVNIDTYTSGVSPREMPASWETAAVRSQAIAARTYGRYAVEHPQNANYDLCDTTSCQVYGGRYRYDSDGDRLWEGFPTAAVATTNLVLTYKGHTIFSQFSASNGGWTVYGGQPYLIARADPYDHTPSNPYSLYSKTVKAATIGHYFGLATITRLAITKRDGHGAWDGRAVVGYVSGTDSKGTAKKIAVTGFDLQAAVGSGTTWMPMSHA